MGVSGPTYIPIDTVLGTPQNRTLRILRYRGWTSVEDLIESGAVTNDPLELESIYQQLLRLTRRRLLSRRRVPGSRFEYMITPIGIAKIRAAYERYEAGLDVLSDKEAA